MVTINRTHTCVTALDRHSRGIHSGAATPIVHWDKHALRLNAQSATLSRNSATLVVFGDNLSPKSATTVASVDMALVSNAHGIISHRHLEFGRRLPYTVTCIVFEVPSPRISHIGLPYIFRNYNHRPTFCCR